MASKVTYLRYPPQQDPTEEILSGLAARKAKADEGEEPIQPTVTPPMQPEFAAQIQPSQAPAPERQPAEVEDPEVRALRHRLQQQFESGLAVQEGNANQMADLVKIQAQAGQNIQSDYSPAMNFVSQLTGIDVSKGYTPPPTGEDKRKELLNILQSKMKNDDTLSDNKVNMLKTLLSEKRNSQNDGRQQRMDQSLDNQAFREVKKSFDKPAQAMSDFNQSYETVTEAIKTGDTFAVQSALSNLARMSGEKGVLTDQDIIRVVPNTLKQKTAQTMMYLKSDPTYPIPPEVQTAMLAGIERMKSAAQSKYKAMLDQQREEFQGGPGSYAKHANYIHGVMTKDSKKAQPMVAVRPPEESAGPAKTAISGAAKPKTVMQGGYTYTLDEATGEYK